MLPDCIEPQAGGLLCLIMSKSVQEIVDDFDDIDENVAELCEARSHWNSCPACRHEFPSMPENLAKVGFALENRFRETIVWCHDEFLFAPLRHRIEEEVRAQSSGRIGGIDYGQLSQRFQEAIADLGLELGLLFQSIELAVAEYWNKHLDPARNPHLKAVAQAPKPTEVLPPSEPRTHAIPDLLREKMQDFDNALDSLKNVTDWRQPMVRRVLNWSGPTQILIFFLGCLCMAPTVHGQDNAAPAFQFTKVDTHLLDEVDEYDRQLVKKGLVLEDPDLQAYLESVGNRVLGGRPAPEQVQFRFRVLRDPIANAFALPNGSVYVTTGLLSVLENEAQLASVLGHETTHVFNRHSYLENRSVRKKTVAINVLAAASSVGGGGALGGVLAGSILTASMYGYSREMEREADHGGLTAMTSASYDPHAMARSFELLDEDEKLEYEPVQGFYHDHPKLTERRAEALEFAEAQKLHDPLLGSETEYLAKVSPAICYSIEADLNSRMARSAVIRAKRMVAAFPEEPKYQVLLADSYRTLGAKTAVASEAELSHHGQSEHRKEYFKMTEQEEQKRLLEKPEGKVILHENLDRAETLYLGVIQGNPSFSEAYRGLGLLYEQQAKYAEAAGEYRRYLELVSGTSLDRLRIERRLANVEKLSSPQPQQVPQPQPVKQSQ